MLCDVTFDDDLSNHLLSCAEPTFQSGSLKRPGSSRQLPSNLRILQNPLSSGFNPEGIYVWHYMPLGEDLARYPGQDTLFFCSANDQWKKLFGFCFFVKPPFSFCLLPPTHYLEPYLVHWRGRGTVSIHKWQWWSCCHTPRAQNQMEVFATSEAFGKVLFHV